MLIHVLGDIGHVKVCVTVVRELLQLRIEGFLSGQRETRRGTSIVTYPSKADLIAKVVEATDAVLGILEVVILDESKAEQELVKISTTCWRDAYPLHRLVLRSMMDFELWISPKRLPQP
jgi:hypothetical protein